MIYLFLINKTKFLTILSFAVIFSVLTMFFSTKAYAAPNNQGLGWAMAIGKTSSSNTCMGTSQGEKVQVILTSSEDHSARPEANVRLTNVAAPGSWVEGNGNLFELSCIDPNYGVWVQVWGNTNYLRWDNSWNGQRYNWGNGFASGDPRGDEGHIVTYYIFLVPNGNRASIEAVYPQPDNVVITIPDTATTTNVTFQVNSIRQLPNAGGGNNVKEVLTWLHKKDGGNLPGCGSDTCFYKAYGSWSFGSTISFSLPGNLPVGAYEWYSQLLEDNRNYIWLSNTYPITAQFANQNFIIQQENGPPPKPQPGTGNLTAWVFNDINGNGVEDAGENTLVPSDAPGTIVYHGQDWPMSQVDNRLEYISTNLTPSNNYKVTLILPDTNWQVTKYSYESLPDTTTHVGVYTDYLDRTYGTVHISVNSGYNSWFKLGVQRQNLPNLTADTPNIANGQNPFVPDNPASVPVDGYINNIGIPKNLGNVNVGWYVDKHIVDSTNISLIQTATTASTNELTTTHTTHIYVYSSISVVGLATGVTHNLQICADSSSSITESNEKDNCSAELPFTIAQPQDQWLKTERGDVGVKGSINMAHPDGDNADYLVISEGAKNSLFTSAKNWLVKNYSPLNVYPTAASNYTSLLALYSKKGIAPVGTSESNVSSLVGSIGQASGPMTIDSSSWPTPYAGGAKVIFVDGDLNINNNLQIADNTGLIFIVSGTTTIATSVTQVDGVFISYGKFNTTSYTTNCGVPLTETHSQLQIHGAVYSFGSTCLTRNLGKAQNADSAELIIYEPKYIVLFREPLGETVTSFKEVTP